MKECQTSNIIPCVIVRAQTHVTLQGSGEDEIVVCAWDGMTYIVDQRRNVVRYQFEENVSAFCAGNKRSVI